MSPGSSITALIRSMPWPEPASDQDVIGRTVDAAQLGLGLHELAQAEMPLIALRRGVHGELRAFLAQRACGGLDQPFDRDQGRVVVPADEVVFGIAGEAHRRGRQVLGEEIGVGEAVAHRGRSSKFRAIIGDFCGGEIAAMPRFSLWPPERAGRRCQAGRRGSARYQIGSHQCRLSRYQRTVFRKPVSKLSRGCPAEVAAQPRRIDRIALVMRRAVGDES